MDKFIAFIRRVLKRLNKTLLLFLARRCKSIVVFAPVYTKDNEKDGYIRRIRTIDEAVLSKRIRFYIIGEHPELEEIRIRRHGKGLYSIAFNSVNVLHFNFIHELVSRCGVLYIHSVYRLLSINPSDRTLELLDIPKLKIIWDVHGAVPEECHLLENHEIGQIAEKAEKRLVEVSDVVICVSRAMETHLKAKYGDSISALFVVLPILGNIGKNHGYEQIQSIKKPIDGKPAVIYSGGLQKWQNVPEMIRLVTDTADYYDYRFIVSDPQELMEMIPADILKRIQIKSVPADEIAKEYTECHFGLVLRDDNTVNNVACPTKIVEYLEYGILPVLKSENIGDFKEMGMEWLSIETLANNNLPTKEEIKEMTNKNNLVSRIIIMQQKDGIKAINTFMKDV